MEKLFYRDTHMTDFTAQVVECRADGQGRFRVSLDATAFFPEEGGQGPDRGTLGGQPVLDVQIRGEEIWHTLGQPLEEGSRVEGHVDWAQRFDYMQQHTGEHILSGLIHAQYGYDNVGFHLGEEEVTMDFNGSLTLEQLRALEREANQVIWDNLPVLISFPEPEALAAMEYRSKLALTENVRIVEIPGVDRCACCAPHVDSTGQIGILKVTNVQSHRGGVRINILCGGRALADYSCHQDSVNAISVLLSVPPVSVAEAALQLKDNNHLLKERANALQEKLLIAQAADLPAPEVSPHAILFTGSLDAKALRNMVNDLTPRYPGYCAIFSGSDRDGYHYVIGSSTIDCRTAAARLRETLHAKGGGTALMVQGSVAAGQSEIEKIFSDIIKG